MAEVPPELRPGGLVRDADLSAVDWSELELEELSLEACVLTDVQFTAVMLRGARFVDCRFVRCRFAHADLRETTFERCSFLDVANHGGVQIAFSRLDEARLVACELSFSDFDRTSLYDIRAEQCALRGARFHKADFGRSFGRNVIRSAATFRACNLQLADLSEAKLAGCDLSGSILREADLSGTDLEGADLRECDLTLAQTWGAKLARADLRGAQLEGLTLKDLGSLEDAKVTLDQARALIVGLGLDVHAK